MKSVDEFFLTDKIRVGQLKEWLVKKDPESKKKIISLVDHRFTNRYLKNLDFFKGGFLKMAISCLTIETLQSFVEGKKDTKRKGIGILMFQNFFKNQKDLFPEFNGIYRSFYNNIRCGILHQAETTSAWRILSGQSAPLLSIKERAINADKFVEALKCAVARYIKTLENSEFETTVWKNAILKLEDICDNCAPKKKKK